MKLPFFQKPTAKDIADIQIEEAKQAALQHQAAAEYHAAMAQMYRARIERLNSTTPF